MSQCIGLNTGDKISVYRTKALAKQAEKAARKKGYRLIPYECRNCDGWHISSQSGVTPKRESKRKSRRSKSRMTQRGLTRRS